MKTITVKTTNTYDIYVSCDFVATEENVIDLMAKYLENNNILPENEFFENLEVVVEKNKEV